MPQTLHAWAAWRYIVLPVLQLSTLMLMHDPMQVGSLLHQGICIPCENDACSGWDQWRRTLACLQDCGGYGWRRNDCAAASAAAGVHATA